MKKKKEVPESLFLAQDQGPRIPPYEPGEGIEEKPAPGPGKGVKEKKKSSRNKDKGKKKAPGGKGKKIAKSPPRRGTGRETRGENSGPFPEVENRQGPKEFREGQGEELPQTLGEWLDLILLEPNFKVTLKFLGLFQSSQVSPEIFYEVARQMLEDEREQMGEFAIYILGATPSLPSFFQLVSLLKRQSKEVGGLHGLVREKLQVYTNLQHLRTLGAVIQRDHTLEASFEALELLSLAAEIHLGAKGLRAGNTPGNTPENTPANTPQDFEEQRQLHREYFDPIVGLLENLYQFAEGKGLREGIQETLGRIQSFSLASNGTP